jgi:hypothetical protein
VISAIALCIAVLPSYVTPTHAHERISGPLLVHSHQPEHTEHSDHSSKLDHGEEKEVLTLSPAFRLERALEFIPLAPAVGVPVPPEPTVLSLSDAEDDPVIHGPPIRIPSLRGPPV